MQTLNQNESNGEPQVNHLPVTLSYFW